MAIRKQAADTPRAMFIELFDRMNKAEDVLRRRALPAGYEFKVISGQLTIVRLSDGATQPLSI